MISQKIRTFLQKLLYAGYDQVISQEEKRHVYLTNTYCLVAGTLAIPYVPIYFYLGAYPLAIIATLSIIGFVGGILMNSRGYLLSSRFSMLFVISFLLFAHGLSLGRESFIQMMYIPLILSISAIFEFQKKALFLLAISIPITFMVLLEFMAYKHALFEPLELLAVGGIYYFNYFMTVFGSLIVMYFFNRLQNNQSDALKEQAAELIESRNSLIATSKIGNIGYSEVDLVQREAIWGPELRNILGVPPDFHTHVDNFFQQVHPEDIDDLRKAFAETQTKGSPFIVTYRYIRPIDDRLIHVQSMGRVVNDENGKPLKMYSVIRDITADKEKEAIIRQEKERAEGASRAKSQFLSNISHEIRTPLHGLLGFASLLEQSDLTDKQRTQLSMIQYSGKTLMDLLNDLLDLSRIEQGKIVIQEKPVDIGELLKSCLASYQLQAKEKGLELLQESNFESYPVIISDPVRIKQILINLVTNAIKYTQQGKISTRMSVEAIEGGTASSLTLKIQVIDTGQGIPEDNQEAIFQPFTQLPTEIVNTKRGLGLGLAIIKSLLELMKGRLELQSPYFDDANAPGSCFSIYLPVKAASVYPHSQKQAIPVGSQFKGMKILVAEDNPVNQLLLESLLAREAFNITLVENGKEALEKVTQEPFDLILMDIHMPMMNGYEAARAIRRILPDIPILALSANAYEEDIQKSLLAGMNAHLSKPFHLEELYKHIFAIFPDKAANASS